ncbi:MAG: DNA polymerase III subunit epsilon [Candidatus Methanofastidiosum methylothiophilum]|uniref:DNA polymerase III subunit epsilon n=1 Tax=Candidatus Methanofastidiosum methylothiophilum TaxID=1705564 RepID=A0A150IQ61_9EURY|nr:MAG: DNA polymerase III subunit epsilon [Candidatus Methanofastidiosum methylthiophilus]KYC47181.1 MAG: DNA polymerase III subunit epsilon [Candidatus Methanofastidiosum methylthiophilus]KYC51476.1 MAG: DNA polymerase III subunit epsilon [Candidatus Methanofastidiosum methylthiophilus]
MNCGAVNNYGSLYCSGCNKLFSDSKHYYLFIDTETSGLPRSRYAPYTDTTNWPRVVQIAWMLCDQTGNILSSEEHIIRPEGFVIPFDAQNIHGISNERAHSEGKDLEFVLRRFSSDINRSTHLIAHNLDFDFNVIGAEFVRKGIENRMTLLNRFCTMIGTTEYCQIPGGQYEFKWPSLIELHYTLFNTTFEEKHDAMHDVKICKECFFELKNRGII